MAAERGPKEALLRIIGRGVSLATELLRVSETVPRVFYLRTAAERARHGWLLLDFGGREDGWLAASARVDATLDARGLRPVEDQLHRLYGDALRGVHATFSAVRRLVADAAALLEALGADGGLRELLAEEEGVRLVAEAVYAAGLALMLLETRIDGALRERLLVAHFRAEHAAGREPSADDAATCRLCRAAPVARVGRSSATRVDWPQLFARAALPQAVAEQVARRVIELGSVFDDELGGAGGTATASVLYVVLFFAPELLRADRGLMDSLAERVLRRAFVLPYFLGQLADLSFDWAPFPAARKALGREVAKEKTVRQLAGGYAARLPVLQAELRQLGDSTGTDDLVAAVDTVKEGNEILQWVLLHSASQDDRLRTAVLEAVPSSSALTLALRLAETEWLLAGKIDLGSCTDFGYAAEMLHHDQYLGTLQDFEEHEPFGLRAIFHKLGSSLRRAGRVHRLEALARSGHSAEEHKSALVASGSIYCSKLFGLIRGVDASLGLTNIAALRSLSLPDIDAKMADLCLGEVMNGLLDIGLGAGSGGPGGDGDVSWTALHEAARWDLPEMAEIVLVSHAWSAAVLSDARAWAVREDNRVLPVLSAFEDGWHGDEGKIAVLSKFGKAARTAALWAAVSRDEHLDDAAMSFLSAVLRSFPDAASSRRKLDGATLLHSLCFAAQRRKKALQDPEDADAVLAAASLLLNAGVSPQHSTADGNVALHWAPTVPVAKLLLANFPPAMLCSANIAGEMPRNMSAAAAAACEELEQRAGIVEWVDGRGLAGRLAPEALEGRLVDVDGVGRGIAAYSGQKTHSVLVADAGGRRSVKVQLGLGGGKKKIAWSLLQRADGLSVEEQTARVAELPELVALRVVAEREPKVEEESEQAAEAEPEPAPEPQPELQLPVRAKADKRSRKAEARAAKKRAERQKTKRTAQAQAATQQREQADQLAAEKAAQRREKVAADHSRRKEDRASRAAAKATVIQARLEAQEYMRALVEETQQQELNEEVQQQAQPEAAESEDSQESTAQALTQGSLAQIATGSDDSITWSDAASDDDAQGQGPTPQAPQDHGQKRMQQTLANEFMRTSAPEGAGPGRLRPEPEPEEQPLGEDPFSSPMSLPAEEAVPQPAKQSSPELPEAVPLNRAVTGETDPVKRQRRLQLEAEMMDALDAITAPAGSVAPTAAGLSVSWGEEDQTQMIAPRRQKRRKKRKKGRRQPKEQES